MQDSDEFNWTEPPGGQRWAERLVDHLVGSPPHHERRYIEAKSEVKLAEKSGKAKIARWMLGVANRMPDVAREYLGGWAVLVVGADSGFRGGVEPIEILELEQGMSRYFGDNVPTWDMWRIPAEDNREILVFAVRPPQWGDPIFLCHSELQAEGLVNGGIYIRSEGATRPAKAREIRALERRSRMEVVDLAVTFTGPANVIDYDEEAIRAAIAQRASNLLGSREPDPALPSDVLKHLRRSLVDPRSAAEFREGVRRWEERCWNQLADGVLVSALRHCAAVGLRIENRKATFLKSLTVTVDVPGVDAVTDDLAQDVMWPPKDPASPGPGYSAGLLPGADRNLQRLIQDVRRPLWGIEVEPQEEGVGIKWHLNELRPEAVELDDGTDLGLVLLVAGDNRPAKITASWKATAAEQNSVFRGTSTLDVQHVDLTGYLVESLGSSLPK